MFASKPKPLSKILSSFTKAVEELEVLQQFNEQEVGLREAKVATLEAQIKSLNEEKSQASKVREKINSLIS